MVTQLDMLQTSPILKLSKTVQQVLLFSYMKVICYACMCIFNTINSTVTYITCMPISHPLIHTFNAQHLESKASLFLEYYVDNDLTINFLRFLYLNNLNSILIKAEHQRFFLRRNGITVTCWNHFQISLFLQYPFGENIFFLQKQNRAKQWFVGKCVRLQVKER